jgi:hypothetical protein
MRRILLIGVAVVACDGGGGEVCEGVAGLCEALANEIVYPGPCDDELVYEDGRLVGMAGEGANEVTWTRSIEYGADGLIERVVGEIAFADVEARSMVWSFGAEGGEKVETRQDFRFDRVGTHREVFAAGYRLAPLELIWPRPGNGQDQLVSWDERSEVAGEMVAANAFTVEYEQTALEGGLRQVVQRERAASGAVVARARFVYDLEGRLLSLTSTRSGRPESFRWEADRLVGRGPEPETEYLHDAAGNLRAVHQDDTVFEVIDYSCW